MTFVPSYFVACRFVCSIDYYGLSLGVDILPGSVFLNTFLSGLIEIPSYLMTCILLNKIGRRVPNSVTLVASGICCLMFAPFFGNASKFRLVLK